MKKLLTLLMLLFVYVYSAQATVTAVSLTWQDGNTDKRDIEQGGSETFTLTYTSDEVTTGYISLEPKDGGWNNNIVASFPFAIAVGTDLTVDVEVTIASDEAVNPDFRFIPTLTENGTFATRLKDANSDHVLRYANIIAPVVPSTLVISSLTWADGTIADSDIAKNTDAVVKVAYIGSIGDSIFANICYKDAWGTVVSAIKTILPSGDGEVSIDVPIRDYAVSADPNRFRIMLASSASALWGQRIDVAQDASSNNDGLYGNIVEQSVVTVEEATAMITGQQNELNEPAGGIYEIGDSIALSVTYNSTEASTFYVRFKSKDNVTKFIEHDQALAATTESTQFDFKIEIPSVLVAYDSVRIVGWIGSWSEDKELEQWIDISSGTPTSIEQLQINSLLYPNPSAGLVNLELEEAAQVTVFDLNGKAVFSTKAQSGVNSFDLSNQAVGLYLLRIKESNNTSTVKLQLK